MKLSRSLFVIIVLLTSGLMAANEIPELLTLTDNVSNDFELACQGPRGCSSQQIRREATTPTNWLVRAKPEPAIADSFFSVTLLEKNDPPPLSTLGVQRK